MKILLIDIERGKNLRDKNSDASSFSTNLLKNITDPVDDIDIVASFVRLKEKKIHEYLMQNERMLLGEYKSHYAYEKHLYYQGSKKYIEGDFINYSYNYLIDKPEVFEVKRPEKKIIKKK